MHEILACMMQKPVLWIIGWNEKCETDTKDPVLDMSKKRNTQNYNFFL